VQSTRFENNQSTTRRKPISEGLTQEYVTFFDAVTPRPAVGAKTRNIQIRMRFNALPAGRLNAPNRELNFFVNPENN
jgi:hypothetical protein